MVSGAFLRRGDRPEVESPPDTLASHGPGSGRELGRGPGTYGAVAFTVGSAIHMSR